MVMIHYKIFVNATSSPTQPRFVWGTFPVQAAELTVLRVNQLDARQPEMWEISGDWSSLFKSWVHILGHKKHGIMKDWFVFCKFDFWCLGKNSCWALYFSHIKYPILSRQNYVIQQEHTLKIPSAQQNPVSFRKMIILQQLVGVQKPWDTPLFLRAFLF